MTRSAALLVVATTVFAASCGPASHRLGPSSTVTSTTLVGSSVAASSPSSTEPPAPAIVWSACQHGLRCGYLTVPLDYSHPAGPSIRIALALHPASVPSERIGSLVINPGGPGGSGIDDLPKEIAVLSPVLLDRFDVVSFDPRGVERSSPILCGQSAGSAPQALADLAPVTREAQKALLADDRSFADACEHSDGPILPFVGTVDVARDLDHIRAALGDERLTYIGHSYGTLLGATYAQMFPTHVRAMDLDAAIDPALDTASFVTEQSVSFEKVLDDFFAWCASASSCPWRPVGDPANALLALIDKSRDSRIPTQKSRQVGPGEIYQAVLDTLYSKGFWPSLGVALSAAQAGDGAQILALSDAYATSNGPNAQAANSAISCLDHPVSRDPSTYPALAAKAGQAAPVLGPFSAWGLLSCAVWPAMPTRQVGPTVAEGSPPILVTGTTGDPATPYQWAVSLSSELARGVLLTWQGESHVAYFYSPCVRTIVASYLVGGVVPAAGTVCRD